MAGRRRVLGLVLVAVALLGTLTLGYLTMFGPWSNGSPESQPSASPTAVVESTAPTTEPTVEVTVPEPTVEATQTTPSAPSSSPTQTGNLVHCTLDSGETVTMQGSFATGEAVLTAEIPVLAGCPIVPDVTTLWCSGEGGIAICLARGSEQDAVYNTRYTCGPNETDTALVCRRP